MEDILFLLIPAAIAAFAFKKQGPQIPDNATGTVPEVTEGPAPLYNSEEDMLIHTGWKSYFDNVYINKAMETMDYNPMREYYRKIYLKVYPQTTPSLLTPNILPETVPGTLQSDTQQGVAMDIIPMETELDVNSAEYINWINTIKLNSSRTLQTYGAYDQDIVDTLRFADQYGMKSTFPQSFEKIMREMQVKYSIDENYIGSIVNQLGMRPM